MMAMSLPARSLPYAVGRPIVAAIDYEFELPHPFVETSASQWSRVGFKGPPRELNPLSARKSNSRTSNAMLQSSSAWRHWAKNTVVRPLGVVAQAYTSAVANKTA